MRRSCACAVKDNDHALCEERKEEEEGGGGKDIIDFEGVERVSLTVIESVLVLDARPQRRLDVVNDGIWVENVHDGDPTTRKEEKSDLVVDLDLDFHFLTLAVDRALSSRRRVDRRMAEERLEKARRILEENDCFVFDCDGASAPAPVRETRATLTEKDLEKVSSGEVLPSSPVRSNTSICCTAR